jgi:hypothetical protein
MNKGMQLRFLVGTFIHEDIHATGPDDGVMAKRFEDMGLFGNSQLRYRPGNATANSLAWGSLLDSYCMPTEAELKKWLKK